MTPYMENADTGNADTGNVGTNPHIPSTPHPPDGG